jgi:beta-xylosidase
MAEYCDYRRILLRQQTVLEKRLATLFDWSVVTNENDNTEKKYAKAVIILRKILNGR